jgi:hypothetical protein
VGDFAVIELSSLRKNVTADHNCWSGIQIIGLSDSKLEKNVFTSNAGGSNGAFCGGT